jgi:DUF1680 family protein
MFKAFLFSIVFLFTFPGAGFSQKAQLQSFPLSSVRLLEGPFKQAQQTDLRYILQLDADKLLSPYLREAGLEPQKSGYGNWEGTGLDGHIGGHYISALADMYAATGNAEVLQRLNHMIDVIWKCQQKNGDGYVGGIPGGKAMWKDVAAGKIKAGTFSLNDKWVPWYNIHKLYAGLIDAWRIAGNARAKEVLTGLSDWCLRLTAGLTDAQIQDMLRSEHGGMNEVFADVAEITGDKKYLELARRFSHRFILEPLLNEKDSLTGLHANTQIPKVIGYMRVAELGGDEGWAKAAEFFWETVVHNRTISIGGNSVREHFNASNNFLPMLESKEGPETCNTYNMLKLTKLLFLNEPAASYMDYYERALYNHILSSQHPEGGFVYFTPIRPRHYRVYSQPQQGFWCCVGSGMENHGKYGELIYAHDSNDLYVNLFIPSTLDWKEKGLKLVQQTRFPFEETTRIKLELKKPATFSLNVRYPSWVKEGQMLITVNGKKAASRPGKSSYVQVNRAWKTGDVVTLTLPMHTRTELLPDNSSWVSFLHGPVVLAAATDSIDLAGLKADDSRMGHIANGPLYPMESAPLVVWSGKEPAAGVKPVKGKPLTFTAPGLIYPAKYKDVQMVPFFTIHDARYMLYWPLTSPEGLEARKKTMQESEDKKLALEARTLDQVATGEQQPESDHNYKGENTETGIFRERHFRNATGSFTYDLRNPGKQARILQITYYGEEKNRNFDIFIGEKLLKTVKMDGTGGKNFIDVDYDLTDEIKASSGETLQVRFVAHPGSSTANIYYVRLLK